MQALLFLYPSRYDSSTYPQTLITNKGGCIRWEKYASSRPSGRGGSEPGGAGCGGAVVLNKYKDGNPPTDLSRIARARARGNYNLSAVKIKSPGVHSTSFLTPIYRAEMSRRGLRGTLPPETTKEPLPDGVPCFCRWCVLRCRYCDERLRPFLKSPSRFSPQS
ncbi:hypothetical protein J6590_057400 [Homalodisca vitripennis]|nr:hypothetical protein J6590_057400 [Homalodisca vitripennis]